jgi:hypothetical protein
VLEKPLLNNILLETLRSILDTEGQATGPKA